MPITADGFFDWMDRVPGPADKVYSTPNAAMMYLPHSAVGYYPGWASRLFNLERLPNGRYTPYAAASVHGWLPKMGTPKQHYPIFASCWASGSFYPNTMGVAFENEGGPPGNESEPLTDWQVSCNIKAIQELIEFRQWDTVRRPTDQWDVGAQLYEHNECTRWGSEPTACPSGRIPWDRIIAALQEEDEMKDEDRAWVLQFSGGTKLLKGSGPDVYVSDHKGKTRFPGGPTEFAAVRFSFGDVITIPDSVLALIPNA